MNQDKPPLIPFLDEASETFRMSKEMGAEMELKRLQKEDKRFNDPMLAYKFLKESAMGF